MPILVIFTGGTIGASVNEKEALFVDVNNVSDRNDNMNSQLIQNYYKFSDSPNKKNVEFETISPYEVLSENLSFNHWNTLISTLKVIDFSKYQGIIVTHGTDTLAYTSNLLGILLAGIPIPIVITGSNISLNDKKTDANRNFSSAVDFIVTGGCPGVYLVFSDGKKSVVYLSTRVKQSKAFIDKYHSVNNIDFGYVKEGRFTLNEHKSNPNIQELQNTLQKEPYIYKIPALNPYVAIIRPYAGIDYRFFSFAGTSYKAVLHELYHSFTAPIGREDYEDFNSIFYLKKICDELGINLYAAPFKSALFDKNTRKYESTDKMISSGIRFVPDISLECAYVKLLVAYSIYENNSEKIYSFLNENIFFERIIQ